MSVTTDERGASGYWYPDDDLRAVDVLNALRAYRSAESAMRKRTRSSMGMGETDLSALRYLLAEARAGRTVSPKDLAVRLEISTASVSVLIDRLEKSGHVVRRRSPTDGRGVIVEATPSTEAEVRGTLGAMHGRMHEVADSMTPEEARAVVHFLRRMTAAVDSIDPPHSER
ncbi:MarR family winged helix-turn-helix transcriptional regulator [Herbiconiux sp. L3-i23]|uniref:MarR family winged helix-turn-helix transcriptional regulator n=1 Tax=Herbiconiux sp. L3-i23 TaxID=2905871 RepID=UPI0020578510|nr:MarR family transcriptional regulator [Herbiconiux sp. L3-i23]BDI21286.1 MarR family transcriptional regulator [Herbiconiux sp. L3-i23]